jgi:hypothetical protein
VCSYHRQVQCLLLSPSSPESFLLPACVATCYRSHKSRRVHHFSRKSRPILQRPSKAGSRSTIRSHLEMCNRVDDPWLHGHAAFSKARKGRDFPGVCSRWKAILGSPLKLASACSSPPLPWQTSEMGNAVNVPVPEGTWAVGARGGGDLLHSLRSGGRSPRALEAARVRLLSEAPQAAWAAKATQLFQSPPQALCIAVLFSNQILFSLMHGRKSSAHLVRALIVSLTLRALRGSPGQACAYLHPPLRSGFHACGYCSALPVHVSMEGERIWLPQW